jgi:hypothetical protein
MAIGFITQTEPEEFQTRPVNDMSNSQLVRYAQEYAVVQPAGRQPSFEREYVNNYSMYYTGNVSIFQFTIAYTLSANSLIVESVEEMVRDMNLLSLNYTRRVRIFYQDREANPQGNNVRLVYNDERRRFERERGDTSRGRSPIYNPYTPIPYQDVLRAIMFMVTSNELLDINELVIVLDIANDTSLRGGTARKADVIKWKEEPKWYLEKIKTSLRFIPKTTEGYCGYIALAMHILKYGSSETIEDMFGVSQEFFKIVETYHSKMKSKKTLLNFVHANDLIMTQLGIYLSHTVFGINESVFDPSGLTGFKMTSIMKKCKIKIFTPKNHPLKQIYGDEYVLGSGDVYNICLYFDADERHYHYIEFVRLFNCTVVAKNNNNTAGCTYCHECNKTFITGMLTHTCVAPKCFSCGHLFDTDQELQQHKNPLPTAITQIPEIYKALHNSRNLDTKDLSCHNCKITCYSMACLLRHVYSSVNSKKCAALIKKKECSVCFRLINSRTAEHNCIDESTHSMKCRLCKLKVLVADYAQHRCDLPKSKRRKTSEVDEELEKFYVFDLESSFTDGPQKTVVYPDGTVASIKNQIHKVNLVCVRQCGTGLEKMFYTIGTFLDWCVEESGNHNKPISMIAHNFKGYDGRMIFDHLLHEGKYSPTNTIWNGSKIMSFNIAGTVIFKDSLLHIQARVADMPKIFGLNEAEFCKGYFPYMFNRLENQDYVGAIPALEYFDPDHMSTSSRKKFLVWYAEQTEQNVEYVFKNELVKYCESDVRILAKALEVYVRDGMLYNNSINPLSKLTIASYAHRVFEGHCPEGNLKILNEHEYLTAKAAMYGGRTDVRRMHVEYSPDGTKYAKYVDVQSLYPAVQYYKPMPIGTPTIHTDFEQVPTNETMLGWFGLVIVDIEPTRYLHHPVLVKQSENHKLCATLMPLVKYTCTCVELHAALRKDYKVTRVYEYHEYQQSTELFKSYVRHFLKLKLESSGLPQGVQDNETFEAYKHELKERLDIDVRFEDFEKNAGKKALAKLMLNSLWGKFAESKNYSQSEILSPEVYNCMLQNVGEFDIKFAHLFNNNDLVVVYANESTNLYDIERAKKTNMVMAAHVTAWGRLVLWEQMDKLGKNVLYHDTDSIIYEHDSADPNGYDIPEGRYLGEWENETGGARITKFVSLGPKTYSYAYLDENGEEHFECKCKGFTLNYANGEKLNYETMVQLLKKEIDFIKTEDTKFCWQRGTGEMTTYLQTKYLSGTYDKGFIDHDFVTYPFGYEKFIQV